MADLYVRGVHLDWTTVIPAPRHPVPLPTTAFQRRRYWLEPDTASSAIGLGQTLVDHPLAGVLMEAPHPGGVVLTGRVGLPLQPWLADHAVGGHVLLPGTALAELAITAGDHTDCPMLDELIIEAPVILPGSTILRLQVTAADPNQPGRPPVAIPTPPKTGDPAGTRHATGHLSSSQPPQPAP